MHGQKNKIFRSAPTWVDDIKMDYKNHLGTEVCTDLRQDREIGGTF